MKTNERGDFIEELVLLGKALDSPERLRLLDALCQAERSVESLADHLGLKIGTVSHHLQKLKTAGMVTVRRSGRFSFYSVSCIEVVRVLKVLRELSVQVSPEARHRLERMIEERRTFRIPGGTTLEDMIASGMVTVIDVRPTAEYDHAHMPGAVSLPVDELPGRMADLQEGRTVLTYCRDRFCDLADRAVEMLRGAGFSAFRLEESLTQRLSVGSTVESADSPDPAGHGENPFLRGT